jgi:hypothetical protein
VVTLYQLSLGKESVVDDSRVEEKNVALIENEFSTQLPVLIEEQSFKLL